MTKDNGTHQPGPWAIMIMIMEQSPPTKLDARVLIKEPEKEPANPPSVESPPNGILASLLAQSSSQKQNPPIEFSLKTGSADLVPVKAGRKPDHHNQKVQTLFTDNVQGTSLQYP